MAEMTFAASGAINDSSVGNQPWQDLANITAQDSNEVYCTLVTANATTNRLRISFDVSALPNGATVTGIRARIRFGAFSAAGRTLSEVEVRLLLGDVVVGSSKHTNSVVGSGSETYTTHTHGGAGDVWGTADGEITVAGLKAGARLLALRYKTDATGGSNSYSLVDYVDLTVYYTAGGGGLAGGGLAGGGGLVNGGLVTCS